MYTSRRGLGMDPGGRQDDGHDATGNREHGNLPAPCSRGKAAGGLSHAGRLSLWIFRRMRSQRSKRLLQVRHGTASSRAVCMSCGQPVDSFAAPRTLKMCDVNR